MIFRFILLLHSLSFFAYSQSWEIPDSIKVLDTIPSGHEMGAIERSFNLAQENLTAMRQDMDIFKLDEIHPRLASLYRQYDLMYLWAGRLTGETAPGIQSVFQKIKKRTEEIHQLFDMGEIQASQIKIIDLLYHFKTEEGKLTRLSEVVSNQKDKTKR